MDDIFLFNVVEHSASMKKRGYGGESKEMSNLPNTTLKGSQIGTREKRDLACFSEAINISNDKCEKSNRKLSDITGYNSKSASKPKPKIKLRGLSEDG